MKRCLLPLLLLLTAACSDRSQVEIAPQQVRPAKIQVVSNASGDVTHEFTARIEALQTVDLSFEVAGNLAELAVKEGETITQGTLIAALEPTSFQLAVKEAEVQLNLAAQDLGRKQKVLAEAGIAKSQVEDAQSNYDLQRVRLIQARERYSDSRIRAPFEAYVSRRYFDQHVNVQPGEPIVRLLDLTRLQVVMNIPEQLLATITAEQVQRSWVEFSFAEGRQFDIAYLENRGEAEALAQTYEVSFSMENPSGWRILPGMTAKASLHLKSTGADQVLVPASALVPMPDGQLAVWVYDSATQQVTRRSVTAAPPRADGIPVTQGLAAGEQIVVTGASQLQPGMKVRPL